MVPRHRNEMPRNRTRYATSNPARIVGWRLPIHSTRTHGGVSGTRFEASEKKSKTRARGAATSDSNRNSRIVIAPPCTASSIPRTPL